MTEPRPAPPEARTDGVRVAVDAMGGDHGPAEIVPGVLDFARAHPDDRLILVGDEATVRGIAGPLPANVSIVHASQVVGMDEHPALALREKKDSSILVATDLVRRGEADAVITAGHTGAGMAAAVLRLGRLPGVDRPALAVQMITTSGPMVLLDIGANPDSTAENLVQYAQMGAIFADRVLGVAQPRVALLSIGEEKGKGDARIARATELLDVTDLNFVGNVEGKDLTTHQADVVVCDAVLGNVVIKFFEGLSALHLRPVAGRVPAGHPGPARVWAPAAQGSTGSATSSTTRRAGGSPLLGVKGTVIITHGRAKRRMIGFACEVAATTARQRVPELIAESLAANAARIAASPTVARCRRRRGGRLVSGQELTVGTPVIAELVRLAALEVPGVARVGRGGAWWRRVLGGRDVSVRLRDDHVVGPALDRGPSGPGPRPAHRRRSASAVAATVERLLGLDLGAVTVLVDGVGG